MIKGLSGSAAILCAATAVICAATAAILLFGPVVGVAIPTPARRTTSFSGCAAETCEQSVVVAQRKGKRDKENLLDKIGLGSLEDIPWGTFPLALGLSALVGAAGGFVYSGLVGNGRPKD
jgi:hypothetical protein